MVDFRSSDLPFPVNFLGDRHRIAYATRFPNCLPNLNRLVMNFHENLSVTCSPFFVATNWVRNAEDLWVANPMALRSMG